MLASSISRYINGLNTDERQRALAQLDEHIATAHLYHHKVDSNLSDFVRNKLEGIATASIPACCKSTTHRRQLHSKVTVRHLPND